VARTGGDSGEDRLGSAEAGFDLHLSKPLDWGRLRRLLADLAARQQADRGLKAGMGSGGGLRSAGARGRAGRREGSTRSPGEEVGQRLQGVGANPPGYAREG